MREQIGDLVQVYHQGLFQLDPYLLVEIIHDRWQVKCLNLVTGETWITSRECIRPLTEENIEEAHRTLEARKKKMHEEMNNFLDKFK